MFSWPGLSRSHFATISPWQPGQSGNPRGAGVHTLKLAAQIRQISDGGREMIELLFSVMRGEPLPMAGRTPKGRRHGPPLYPSPELRVRCAEILLDRGWGRAKEILEVLEAEAESRQQRRMLISEMTPEERDQLRALLQQALERAERAERGGQIPPAVPSNGQAAGAGSRDLISGPAGTGPDGRPPA